MLGVYGDNKMTQASFSAMTIYGISSRFSGPRTISPGLHARCDGVLAAGTLACILLASLSGCATTMSTRSVGVGSRQAAGSAADYVARGKRCHDDRRYDKAIIAFTKAIQLDAECAEAFNGRGLSRLRSGGLEAAILDFDKAIDLKPDYAEAFRNRGTAFGFKRDYDREIEDRRTARTIEQSIADGDDYTVRASTDDSALVNPQALTAYRRGIAFLRRGSYHEAIIAFTEAIGHDHSFAEAHRYRGDAHASNHDFDQAVKDYTKAIGFREGYANAYHRRGLACMARKEFNESVRDLTRAIELDANHAEAYESRGAAYLEMNQCDTALADLTRAIDNGVRNSNAYEKRGFAYACVGDPNRAIADYTEAIRRNPDAANPWIGRAAALALSGQLDRAIGDYDKAIRLEPTNPELFSMRGQVRARSGQSRQAIADFNRAIKLNPENAAALNHRATAYLLQGEYDLAVSDSARAIQLAPNEATAYMNRGVAYGRMGQLDRASADCRRAIEVDPALKGQIPSFDAPPLTLPVNGAIVRYNSLPSLAPLTIVTQPGTGHHFVKVVDWASGGTVLTIFVHGGSRASTDVPLGSYELRYAVGDTWYGPALCFGKKTKYARPKARLEFSRTPRGYQGHTVTLIPQVGGNLATERISADDF